VLVKVRVIAGVWVTPQAGDDSEVGVAVGLRPLGGGERCREHGLATEMATQPTGEAEVVGACPDHRVGHADYGGAMKLEVGHFQVTELIELVQTGKLALPEFQRDFVWKPDGVCDLLCSVARKWPIGSFLVMEAKERPFELRTLEHAPDLAEEPELIVLDGQQRCTSFYHAFTDNSPDVTFYLQFPEDWGTFDDEQIRFERKARFVKRWPNLEAMAKDRVIKISDLHGDEQFEQWKEHLPDAKTRQLSVAFRSNEISGLKDITVPHSKLSGDPDLRAVAKIFETINRTGKKLDTFDLLVARLYPFDFRLRDRWEEAFETHDELRDFGIDGLEILKLIALRRYSQEVSKGLKLSVKGVRQSDVLLLEPDTVKSEWPLAVDAYVAGLQFLRDKCGVAGPALLPQPSMPLTVGFFVAPDRGKRAGFLKDLERWYWASCFRQTYAQAANTQVLADEKALRAWDADETAVPDVVAGFTISDGDLLEGRRLNEMLLRGILGRMIALGARDWTEDLPIAKAESIDFHHIFPAEYLELNGVQPKDPLLNFAAIAGSTNKRIRNELPETVMKRPDIDHDDVATHCMKAEWVVAEPGEAPSATVARFMNERLTLVRALVEKAVAGK
jgi:hypothetical protein